MIGVFSTFAFVWSLGSYFALVASVQGKPKPWLVLALLAVSNLSAGLGFMLGLCGIVIDENKIAAFAGCFLNLLGVVFWLALYTAGAMVITHALRSPLFH